MGIYGEKCKGEWESSLGGGKCRTKEQYREVTKCVLLRKLCVFRFIHVHVHCGRCVLLVRPGNEVTTLF